MQVKPLKAFDLWAAKVDALSSLDINSRFSIETHLRSERALHFESYWKMVFMPLAKEQHDEALKAANKPKERASSKWREIANHSWRTVIKDRVKKLLHDRLMIFKETKAESGFIF
jgi:hypothetical protein